MTKAAGKPFRENRSLGAKGGAFPATGQSAYAGAAAQADADILQCMEEVVEDLIDHLLVDGNSAWKLEAGRNFLGDVDAEGVGNDVAATVPDIGDGKGSLQNITAGAIDVELTAGEPAKVAGVGRIEKEQWGLPVLGGDFHYPCSLFFFHLDVKTGLTGNAPDCLCFQFEKDVFLAACLQHLHLYLVFYYRNS